jgi:hypothetical protein
MGKSSHQQLLPPLEGFLNQCCWNVRVGALSC